MPSKYGVQLTDASTWKGLPVRVGHYPGEGRTEGLVGCNDTLLVWSGGMSDVTIVARDAPDGSRSGPPRGAQRHHLLRRGGMIDLLPRQVVLDEVRWRGQASGCVAVELVPQLAERWMGHRPELDPARGLRLGVTDAHVVDLIRRLEEQALGGSPCGDLYVEALSLTLTSYVYARYGRGVERAAGRAPGLTPMQSERLVAFVDDHLSDSIGLSELAGLVGYSPNHFARLFKQSFGVSPYQYVLARRLERARSMLREGSQSIAEVAGSCGFATQAHFSTVFRERTGMTPGAFRKA